ncbi:MAG: hypothetical protein JWP48_815 [Actinoallomurus sp.]|nr:hypothetical protein [Actinoallomurus sp.]
MDRFEAARALGLADADVVEVLEGEHGTEVAVRDGGRRLIREDGVYALDGDPTSAHLRRWVEPQEAAPEPEKKPEPAKKAPARSRAKA